MRKALADAIADDWQRRWERSKAALAVAAFARFFDAPEPEDDRCG